MPVGFSWHDETIAGCIMNRSVSQMHQCDRSDWAAHTRSPVHRQVELKSNQPKCQILMSAGKYVKAQNRL